MVMDDGSLFNAGGMEIELDWAETGDLLRILGRMPVLANDLAIAIQEGREAIPGTDEEAGVLLGALEILLQHGHESRAMRRLHYALRQRRRPDTQTHER